MNTNLYNNQKNLNDTLAELLAPKTKEEKIEWEAQKMSLDFIFELQELMKQKGWTKKDLAEKLGTSKSYITQLFSGDKLLNMKLLAKLSLLFDTKFVIVPYYKAENWQPSFKIHFNKNMKKYTINHFAQQNQTVG